MLFNSHEFLFGFLPLTFAGFFLIARYVGRRPALVFLGLASIVFYGWWNWRYVPLLLLSIVVNYLVARGILATEQMRRRAIFFAGVAFDLGLLGYFKYANFFVDSIGAVSGTDLTLDPIILPIGISFFTLTQIAYLADAYANKAGEYDFGRYLLFVTYFPHLIAGPILHHREMMPQFADPPIYRFRMENLATGLTILVIGLVKKLAIADQIAAYATSPPSMALRRSLFRTNLAAA
jgi:alginate O-acetyltransferase complex protein AlgI